MVLNGIPKSIKWYPKVARLRLPSFHSSTDFSELESSKFEGIPKPTCKAQEEAHLKQTNPVNRPILPWHNNSKQVRQSIEAGRHFTRYWKGQGFMYPMWHMCSLTVRDKPIRLELWPAWQPQLVSLVPSQRSSSFSLQNLCQRIVEQFLYMRGLIKRNATRSDFDKLLIVRLELLHYPAHEATIHWSQLLQQRVVQKRLSQEGSACALPASIAKKLLASKYSDFPK